MHRVAPTTNVYSIDALVALGFSRRTIYYYVGLGLLPRAHGRGKTAYYTDVHLRILREIREARDARRTLSDIREETRRSMPHAFRGQ